jgi:hypothetical protein
MSGTIASRFQTRFGYGPALRAGVYPGSDPAPQQPIQQAAQPAQAQRPAIAPPQQAAPQAAPQQPAATPIYSGSIGVSQAEGSNASGNSRDDERDGFGGGQIGSDAAGNVFGLGPNPGDLGSGLSGLGVAGNWGTLGSTLGGLAGLALGVPGLGLAAGALGTYADREGLNGTLTDMGMAPEVEFGPAFASNATLGAFGRSAVDQYNGAATRGQDYPAVDAFFGFNDLPMQPAAPQAPAQGGGVDFAGPADVAGVGTGYGEGFGDYGNMGNYGNTPGFSGDFGGGGDYGGGYGNPGAGDGGFGMGETGSPDFGGAGYGDSGYGSGDYGDSGYGYQQGGYTGHGGDGVVQPHRPAGTVHEGEFVANADATAHYGPELLSLLNTVRVPRSRLEALLRG